MPQPVGVRRAQGSAAPLDLVSHWHIAAPVERVWAALADIDTWPRWWPGVRAVRTLVPAGADGLGGRRLVRWATRLRGDIEIELEAVELLRHERIRGRCSGALRGEGLWLLHAEGTCTALTCVWRLELGGPWMRWLAPLLRWNHEVLMRAGGDGLARHLAGPASPLD